MICVFLLQFDHFKSVTPLVAKHVQFNLFRPCCCKSRLSNNAQFIRIVWCDHCSLLPCIRVSITVLPNVWKVWMNVTVNLGNYTLYINSVCWKIAKYVWSFRWQCTTVQEAQLSLTNRAMLVCKVVEVWQDFLSEYVDKKFSYICYRRLIRHE